MKKNIIFIIVILVLCIVSLKTYETIRGPVEASIATSQVNDSKSDFIVYKSITYDNAIPKLIYFITMVLLVYPFISLLKGLYLILTTKEEEKKPSKKNKSRKKK